jgi:hypothetical protein
MDFKPLPMPARAKVNLLPKLTAITSGDSSDSPPGGIDDIVTAVADLSNYTVTDPWVVDEQPREELKRNIMRPRYNLGGNGPPGRTD